MKRQPPSVGQRSSAPGGGGGDGGAVPGGGGPWFAAAVASSGLYWPVITSNLSENILKIKKFSCGEHTCVLQVANKTDRFRNFLLKTQKE